MNEIIGFASAAIIGISLGLIGGGGSILTLPVLVYLFHLSPAAAISYSLFIVGSTSLAGAAISCWKKQINMRAVFTFGMASVVTVLVIRKFLIPYIPAIITHIGSFEISFSFLTMVLFALLMLITSFSMIRTRRIPQHIHHSKARLILYGIGIGLVTGFLGAGGGFLLIPALVMFMGMGMKKAIGTSLMIIAANSLIGFIADLSHYSIDWKFLTVISSVAILGVLIGSRLNKNVSSDILKKIFGWFVLAMALFILVKEIFFHVTV